MKKRVIEILAFAVVSLLVFAVACGSTGAESELHEGKTYNYIQLPPELTTWSEEVEDGSFVSDALVIRDDQPYRLTQEEYHRLMDDGDDIDEVLADRENWAAEWRGYVPPTITYPDSTMIGQGNSGYEDVSN